MATSEVLGRSRRVEGWLRAQSTGHRGLAAVMVLGTLVRLLTAATYWPALTFSDSFAYVQLAYRRFPVNFEDDRPNGYPVLIRLLLLPFKSLGVLTTFQHLAGLAIGLFVYVLLLQVGVRKWFAVGAVALIVLDSYLVGVEEYVATETFFVLLVVAAIFLVATRPLSARLVAASGLLLASATLVRTAGLFVVPIWLVYVLWAQRRLLFLLAGVVAVIIPLFGYAVARDAAGHGFGLDRSDGWFLYGRVGAIVDSCRGADVAASERPLCRDVPSRHSKDPGWYVWNQASPAYRLHPNESPTHAPQSNSQLRSFAVAIIRARPFAYFRVTAADVLAYFKPSRGFGAMSLPRRRPEPSWFDHGIHIYIPSYTPLVRAPAPLLNGYWRWAHDPRWLLGLLALGGLVAAAIPSPRGGAAEKQRQVALLATGSGAAIVVGTAATVEFALRYLTASSPMLIVGGAIALERLTAVVTATRLRETRAGVQA